MWSLGSPFCPTFFLACQLPPMPLTQPLHGKPSLCPSRHVATLLGHSSAERGSECAPFRAGSLKIWDSSRAEKGSCSTHLSKSSTVLKASLTALDPGCFLGVRILASELQAETLPLNPFHPGAAEEAVQMLIFLPSLPRLGKVRLPGHLPAPLLPALVAPPHCPHSLLMESPDGI